MALRIRLARGGAKKRPYYRIVVADQARSRDGRFIERIGAYNPMLPKDDPNRVKFDEERAKHWIGVGAKPSERVQKFFANAGRALLPKEDAEREEGVLEDSEQLAAQALADNVPQNDAL